MPYWENVTRSFAIVWRHKYLWLLAIFAGEGSSGFNFSYRQGIGPSRGAGGAAANPAQQFSTWLSQHAGLIAALTVISLILVVAFFILAAVCEGALIRGSAEHDADRPFSLREAWTNGVHTMWVIVRFRLLLFALTIPALIIITAVVVGAIAAGVSGQTGLLVVLVLLAILLGLALILYIVYLSFLDRFGARIAILEEQPAVASLRRAHRLLFKRLGRSLLVWLVSIAVAIVVGIASSIGLLIAAIPLIIGIIAVASGGTAGWALIVFGAIVLLVIGLPIAGFVSAQSSTYWTLSFRRMELDFPPVFATPPQPAPQP